MPYRTKTIPLMIFVALMAALLLQQPTDEFRESDCYRFIVDASA